MYMEYHIMKASKGWLSSFTSGEAIVCRFKGPGTVLIQTRNPIGFGSWIQRIIPFNGSQPGGNGAGGILRNFSL